MSTTLNNAVGGWNNNAVDATTVFPGHYRVDYVHVYSNNPNVPAVTPQPGYNGGGGTTPLPPSPSADGTKITRASDPAIIDQAGNAWTLVQSATKGLQIAINGVVNAPTSNVVLLEKLNGNMVQDNTSGNWYSSPSGSTAIWTQIANPVSLPPPPITSHQLILVLSEDRYQGDAQFIAKVDGQTVGGPTSVTALERLGQTQSFTFTGQWSAGTHDVGVDFTNDRYDGSVRSDRNLYVENVKYDGASYLDHQVALMSNGTVHFAVGQA
jgi:hypothetical protein